MSISRKPTRAPESVKALLGRISRTSLARVADQRQAQEDWRSWLKKRLSSDLDAHVTGVVENSAGLTVFADSAVWSARLRFAVAEIETQIRERNAAIEKIAVKVMPRR